MRLPLPTLAAGPPQIIYKTVMQQMKIILAFLFISTCLEGVAQDPRLFEGTWYLRSLNIDGENYQPPSNNEVPFIDLDFAPKPVFSTNVCDALNGTVSHSELQFTFDSFNITQQGCVDSENGDFQDLYLNNFYEDNISSVFNYFVIEVDGLMNLMISSASGDQAIYSNHLLSNSVEKTAEFIVYPNPTKNTLNLPVDMLLEDHLNAIIYDLNGRPIIELIGNLKDKSIDVTRLKEGLYILKLTTKTGQFKLAKFIKL